MKTTKQLAALEGKLISTKIENNELSIYTKAGALATKQVSLPNGIYSTALIKLGELPEKSEETEPASEPTYIFNPIKNEFPLSLFESISKFSGNDEIRPQLMGVFYDAENKKIVATNAHVLRFENIDLGSINFILPTANIKEVAKIAKISTLIDATLFGEDDKPSKMRFTFADSTAYICSLESGAYPNWLGVIPKYETGHRIKISKQTQSEMMQYTKDLALSGGSGAKFQQVLFNIDTNTATIEDINLGCSKSWTFESEQTEYPEICGLVVPVLMENCTAENYFGINMYYMNNANTEELYYNCPTKALLIPSASQDSPKKTTPKKQAVKPIEQPTPEPVKPIEQPEPEQVDEYPEPEPIKHTSIKAISTTKAETAPEPISRNIKVVDYSEKAIAVVGDTKLIKEELKAAGGRFNAHLKCGAGWIFSKKKTDIVNGIIK